MSSYLYGNATAEPSMDAVGSISAGGAAAAVGGVAVIAAATVVVGAISIAAVAQGATYSIYAIGNTIYEETERAKKESERKEALRLAKLKARTTIASQKQNTVIEKCAKCASSLDKWLAEHKADIDEHELTELRAQSKKLNDIIGTKQEKPTTEQQRDDQTVQTYELKVNHQEEEMLRAYKKIDGFVQGYGQVKESKKKSRIVYDGLKDIIHMVGNSEDREGVVFSDFSVREQEMQPSAMAMETYVKLVEEARCVFEIETRRSERMPLSAEDRGEISVILGHIRNIIDNDDMNAELLPSLQGHMRAYEVLAFTLDDKEEQFEKLYLTYKSFAPLYGDTVRPRQAFVSLEELQRVTSDYQNKFRLYCQRCEEKRKLGDKAYIKLAFDTVLREMGHTILPKQGDEPMVIDYSLGSAGVMNVTHGDGTTTIETHSLNATINPGEYSAVQIAQNAHCNHTSEIQRRLKEEYFVTWNVAEYRGPDDVTPWARAADYDNQNQWNGSESWEKGDAKLQQNYRTMKG